METGYDTLLKLLESVLNVSQQNPYAVIFSVFTLFVAYGFIRYQMKKVQDAQVSQDRNNDLSNNIDELENEINNSNIETRRRLRHRRD